MVDFANPPARPDAGQPSDFAYVVRPGSVPVLYRVPVSLSGSGAAGVGIASAAVNTAGHLILTRTDNTTIDAGYVVGAAGTGTAGTPYILPSATSVTVGGIKSSTTISVAADGTANVIGSASIPALPSALTSADLFPVLRAGNTYAATTAQAAAGLGAPSVPGTGTTPAATPFADVTGASWTIEQIAARVAAINGGGVAPAVPGQVTALTIGTPTSISLPLTWTAPSTGGALTAYTVEYRLTGGTTYTVASSSVTTTAYVIPGLTAATPYDTRVTATNATGAGTPSAVVSATTASAAATNAIAFTGAAGAPTGNQVLTQFAGTAAVGRALDGSGNLLLGTAANAWGVFQGFGSKPDGTLKVTFTAGSTNRDIALLFRANPVGEIGYVLISKISTDGTVSLLRDQAGGTSIGTLTGITCTSTLEVVIAGNVFTLKVDGVAKQSYTDIAPIAAAGTNQFVGVGSGTIVSPQTSISQVSFV